MKPSSSEIENQVNLILESKDFQSSSKLSEFLRFIVKETVKGNEDQLKGYTIATRVLGRGEDFDQSKDPIVRILAGRLRRALEYYYHTNGKTDRIHIDIPVGSYIPEFSFNNNGSGDILGADIKHQELKWQQKIKIAVFPFKDFSGDSQNRPFLSALYEDIIFRLSRFRFFEISALRSGRDDKYNLCRENGTRFILEGSFRRERNTRKIYTELVDLKLDRVIRAEKYDIKLRNKTLFDIGEDIADKIVSVTGSEYGIIRRNLETEIKPKEFAYLYDYEFIVSFYSIQHCMEQKAIKSYLTSLEKVLTVRPGNSELHTAAAGASIFSYIFDLNAVKGPLDYSRSHLIKPYNLESDNQMTRAVNALLYFLQNKDKLFRDEFDAALLLNPNSPYYRGLYGFLLINSGLYEKGVKYLKSGMQMSHSYPSWFHIALAAYQFKKKRYEFSYNESLKINLAESFWSHIYTIASLGKMRKLDEAKKEIIRLKKVSPYFNKKAVELISRFVKDKSLLSGIIDGLKKGGMKL